MNGKYYILISTIFFLTGFSSVQAASVDGVIKGAQCFIQGDKCGASKSDPHLVLENDFVLVSGSKYYFLPNLPRNVKLNFYNENIRIDGNVSGKKIDVERVTRKLGTKNQVIWDQAEIDSELYEN